MEPPRFGQQGALYHDRIDVAPPDGSPAYRYGPSVARALAVGRGIHRNQLTGDAGADSIPYGAVHCQ